MGNIGMAISQRGYDVKTCADRQLVYSSAFQTLKLYERYSVSATIPSSGTTTITIEHNLGFYAPFIVMYNGTGNATARIMSGFSGTSMHKNMRQYENKLEIDVKNEANYGSAGQTAHFVTYIFYDDFRTVAERNISTGFDTAVDSHDYGQRISKEGYDVKDCENDELILSSSFFTSIVHKKGIATGGLANVPHNLGYICSALVFGRSSGGDYIRMCEGMPYYLNPFSGGREGWFYLVNDTEMECGENYLDGSEGAWRTGNTFYYIIFKTRTYG